MSLQRPSSQSLAQYIEKIPRVTVLAMRVQLRALYSSSWEGSTFFQACKYKKQPDLVSIKFIIMQQSPTNWAALLKNQLAEKKSYLDQIEFDQKQRKQKYKAELETDMILKQQQKQVQRRLDQDLEQQTLSTLQQREMQKMRELEIRRMQEVETSLENLNNQLIRKKLTQERKYQKLLQDQDQIQNEKILEMKSQERMKLQKEHDKQQLRENYDSQIQLRQQQNQATKTYFRQPQQGMLLPGDGKFKGDDLSKYQLDLNQQLEEKRSKLKELQQKKLEERQKIEQKIAFEKQKMFENKLKDFQMYKQYEIENQQLLKEKQPHANVHLNPQDIQMNWNEISNKPRLPHIYCENYLPYERSKQLQQLDRDLNKYSQLQKIMQPTSEGESGTFKSMGKIHTPCPAPPTQSSKKSKSSHPSLKGEQAPQGEGSYAKIHSSKTQTPMSKQSKKSQVVQVNIQDPAINQYARKQPISRSYNILTGALIN